MRGQTIGSLARTLGVDVDDVLLALWDCGLTQFNGKNDIVFTVERAAVSKALGLPLPSQLNSPDYWAGALKLQPQEFTSLLGELQIQMRPSARRLPRGAVRKLRAEVRRRGAEPGACVEAVVGGHDTPKPEPFDWFVVGTQPPKRFLSADEVEQIHHAIAEDFRKQDNPIFPTGVKERRLLDSAVARPLTSLGNETKYPTIEMAGAALLHSLVLNHPFHNGNKRTALVALLVFLEENGCVLMCKEKDLFKFVLLLAKHALVMERDSWLADREVQAGAQWLRHHSRALNLVERRIKWWRLKRNLSQFDCGFDHANTGNRINISRTISERGRFGRGRTRTLWTQVHCRNEGTDVDRAVVAKVRHDLELDVAHGVDSLIFYGERKERIDDWIDNYRRTLQRLSQR